MIRLFFTILFLFYCAQSIAQSAHHFNVDSSGMAQGKYIYPSGFTYVKNGKNKRGYEVWDEGYYVNDFKEGVWNSWLDGWKLIGTRHYENGHLRKECSLKKGRLVSEVYYDDSGNKNGPRFIYRVVSYDRKGRVKSDERFEKEEK